MSLSRLVEAPCANCNNLLDALVWQSVNVSSDPFLKTLFWHQKINVAECENCHWVCQLHLPFFYHDLQNDFLVVSMPEDMDEATKRREILSIKSRLSNFGNEAYQNGVHFVDGFTQLKQKVLELDGPPKEPLSLLSWLQCPYSWFGGLVPQGWEPVAFSAPTFESGTPVILKFEVSNLSRQPIRLPTSHRITTAEMPPIFGEVAIECGFEGKNLPSRSWTEFAAPKAADVVELAPGAALQGEVDLAFLFPLKQPGSYTVRLQYRIAAGQNDLDGTLPARRTVSVVRHFVIEPAKPAGGILSMFRRKKTAAHIYGGAKLLAAWWDGGARKQENPELKEYPIQKALFDQSLREVDKLKKTGQILGADIARKSLESLLTQSDLSKDARSHYNALLDAMTAQPAPPPAPVADLTAEVEEIEEVEPESDFSKAETEPNLTPVTPKGASKDASEATTESADLEVEDVSEYLDDVAEPPIDAIHARSADESAAHESLAEVADSADDETSKEEETAVLEAPPIDAMAKALEADSEGVENRP